jgi:hypothetical protein
MGGEGVGNVVGTSAGAGVMGAGVPLGLGIHSQIVINGGRNAHCFGTKGKVKLGKAKKDQSNAEG